MANSVFVIGVPRSGTTLLRLLLTAHSDICIPPESLFFVALEPKYGSINNLLPQIEDFLNDLYSESFSKFCEWNIDRKVLSNNLKSCQELSYALAVETVYKTYCQQHDPKTLDWGDKNPSHIYHVEKIRQYFPMSKVILIVRDFRACYSSIKNIIAKEQEAKEVWTGPKTLKEMECQWNQIINLIDKYHQKNEQFYLVFYERLVEEPSAQLIEICKWLGVNFQETMLNFYQKNIELNLVPPNRAVFHPNTFKPIDRERIDNWQSKLSIAEIEAIQMISGENLKKLGYKCI